MPSQKMKRNWGRRNLYVPVMKGKRQLVVEAYSCRYILPRAPSQDSRTRGGEGFSTQNGLIKVKERFFSVGRALLIFSMLLSFVLFLALELKWRASSLDTAVGVFGIIHRLGAYERTASNGLGSCKGLRARIGRRGNRRLGCIGKTILHGRGLALVRRRADFNDMTMGRSRRGGKFGIVRDAGESVSGARRVRDNRRKNGRCSFDGWRRSARRERTIFYRGVWSRRRHLVLDLVELLLVVVWVEGAWWAAASDFCVTGLLVEGIGRRGFVSRRVWERGGGATTWAKGSVGRRG